MVAWQHHLCITGQSHARSHVTRRDRFASTAGCFYCYSARGRNNNTATCLPASLSVSCSPGQSTASPAQASTPLYMRAKHVQRALRAFTV